jgi:HAD superfamily hydrolase (TIGR01450 family)
VTAAAAHHDAAELERLRRCRAFLLDMDGTIYVDEKLVPGAREFLARLDASGKRYLFLTNNSSRRAADYHARLARLGIHARPDQVMTSGDATIGHLLVETPHRSAYVVGTPALVDDFRAAGVDVDAADPDCVVVGFDTTLTFAKLERACTLLFAGKPYFATHPDKTCITTHGLIPDIAAIIAACEAVTGRVPKIIGKPFPEMVGSALRRLGAHADETAMVGDQLDTDLTMARTAGLCGVLVMSGETTPAKLEAWPVAERPRLRVASVAELAALL